MSHRWLLALVVLVPASASADAIMPFDGECFPGSRRVISNHAEACIPIVCTTDAECGEGARCATLCTCRAEREFQSDGRMIYDTPVRRVVELGLCDAQGACAEGEVGERKQCEPIADTPAFDRVARRWTARTHVGGGRPASSEGEAAPGEAAPGEARPAGGACAGCAVPPRRGGAMGVVLAVGAMGLWRTRRARG